MFKCEQCGKSSKAREKANKKVVATRIKKYDRSVGKEIVKEITICDACKKKGEIDEKV